MTFRVMAHGEPVLNGWTNRPASWPTREAAQAWIDYWGHLWRRLGENPCVVIEHHKEES